MQPLTSHALGLLGSAGDLERRHQRKPGSVCSTCEGGRGGECGRERDSQARVSRLAKSMQ